MKHIAKRIINIATVAILMLMGFAHISITSAQDGTPLVNESLTDTQLQPAEKNETTAATLPKPLHLVPHVATYTANIRKGISLKGSATRRLQQADNGVWKYSFDVKTTPADIKEYSTFLIDDSGSWISQTYYYELTGFFVKDRKQRVVFDQSDGRAHETYKDREWKVDVSDDVLDRLSYQLRLQSQVADPNASLVYQVLHKGEIRTYPFAVLSRETISTALGEKDAIVAEKVRAEGKKRETRLWFDAQSPHALLRMIQVEDSGEEYEINISALELL